MTDKEIMNVYRKACEQIANIVWGKCNGFSSKQIADVISAIADDDEIIMKILSGKTDDIHIRMQEIPVFSTFI